MGERHYGLELGDEVHYPNCTKVYRVTSFDATDNNRCRLTDDAGNASMAVCEWCTKINKEKVVNKKHIIISQGDGWYNFDKIDQTNFYIKIRNLRCGSDTAAINQARRILKDRHAEIEIQGGK